MSSQDVQQAPASQSPEGRELDREQLSRTRLRVCVLAALCSGAFGWLAGLGYAVFVPPGEEGHLYQSLLPDNRYLLGLATGVGIVLGLVAGRWWVGRMVQRAAQGRLLRPRSSGAWLGLQAGVGTAVVLHLILVAAEGCFDLGLMLTGVGCGVLAGLMLGLPLGGLSVWREGLRIEGDRQAEGVGS